MILVFTIYQKGVKFTLKFWHIFVGFYDQDGYFFDKEGYDEFGGNYDEEGFYHPGEGNKHEFVDDDYYDDDDLIRQFERGHRMEHEDERDEL